MKIMKSKDLGNRKESSFINSKEDILQVMT